jgi:hypothetical protein
LNYETDITARGLDKVSDWTLDNSKDLIVDYVTNQLETSSQKKIAIDIADYYIPHLETLAKFLPVKILHLRMPRKITIKSHFYSNHQNNFFQDHDRLIFDKDAKDLQYPTYSSDLLRIEAIAKYCDEYESAVDAFAHKNPGRIAIFDLDIQTSEDTIKSMLEYILPNRTVSPNLIAPIRFHIKTHPILFHRPGNWGEKIRHDYL